MKYRNASLSDREAIRQLLESNSLPAKDFADHIDNFFVAEYEKSIVGVGGYENCGKNALIRSFAVASNQKNNGIADNIFHLVRNSAIESGITQFYLLTTSASNYFEKFGFKICDRVDAPDQIKETRQFSELCPSNATIMVLDL